MEKGGEMVTTFLGFARHDMIPLSEQLTGYNHGLMFLPFPFGGLAGLKLGASTGT